MCRRTSMAERFIHEKHACAPVPDAADAKLMLR
jgi:hypothetical protein